MANLSRKMFRQILEKNLECYFLAGFFYKKYNLVQEGLNLKLQNFL